MGNRSLMRYGLLLLSIAQLFLAISLETCAAAVDIDFDTQIAPLIAKRCARCHNGNESKGGLDLTTAEGLKKGGESGPVVEPENPEKSLLWNRISQREMPPKEMLTDSEISQFQRWMADGGKWGQRKIDPFEFSSESRAGLDWWSLKPIHDSPTPACPGSSTFCQTAIDSFIVQRLTEVRQTPTNPTSPAERIRRISLSILGLPPDPASVDAFVEDTRPDSYDRLVDRLLAAPQFGERWARHWLDIIRFGESQGFERDKLRTNAWRYRDWVIRSLNSDMPYDTFVRWQLAGDVFASSNPASSDTKEALIATGFLVAGAYDEVGQQQQSAAMRAVVRQDEIEDLIASVAQTFLGLTVNCARCHDHKFDPISQREYYRLAAALGGVHHGDRAFEANVHEQNLNQNAIAGLQLRKTHLANRLKEIEQPVRDSVLRERAESKTKLPPPNAVSVWEFQTNFDNEAGTIRGTSAGHAVLADGKLVLNGSSHVATAPLNFELKEKTLEVWVQLSDLNQRAGGVMSVQTHDGTVFDAIVYAEQEPAHWLAGSNNLVRTKSLEGTPERDALQTPVHFAISYHADGKIAAYRNGLPYGKPYMSSGLATFKAGETVVLFGLRHSPPGGNRFLRGSILRACLYDRALTPQEIAASAGTTSDFVEETEFVSRLPADQLKQREILRFEIEQVQSQIDRWSESKIYAVAPKAPAPTFVLARGQPSKPGEEVTAGSIRAVSYANSTWEFGRDDSDVLRRERLVNWITDRNNPLFARVIVNRIWQYHFGSGIVETTNDFGFNGTRPSHLELLDKLASRLWEYDGRLKPLHRQILLSATYQQSSRNRPEMLAIDARNRLLWRMEPLRLEAEVIRDSMLSVTGELNSTFGGPGFYDFSTHVHNTQFYQMRDPEGFTFNRRSVYRTWVRSGRNNFLDVFDCPDPSTKTPTRAVTTTPLQSLALLNSSFALRAAERLAGQLERQFPQNRSKQIQQALRLTFGRPSQEVAAPDELAEYETFVERHGMAALCRVLFNSNEFLYSP